MNPSYRYRAFDGAAMILFNPGTKENGGVFCQPQGWAILAEALRGHGNRAFQYYQESSPASFNEDADRRVIEPYVHGQFIEGHESPFAGRSHVHWLTGTASTSHAPGSADFSGHSGGVGRIHHGKKLPGKEAVHHGG